MTEVVRAVAAIWTQTCTRAVGPTPLHGSIDLHRVQEDTGEGRWVGGRLIKQQSLFMWHIDWKYFPSSTVGHYFKQIAEVLQFCWGIGKRFEYQGWYFLDDTKPS